MTMEGTLRRAGFSTFRAAMIQSLAAVARTAQRILPLDPPVRRGTLPNGLMYKIRANGKPELLRAAAVAYLNPRRYVRVVLYP